MEAEHDSDLVLLGKLLHERSYQRKLKEVELGRVKLDFVESNREVHEIKRSRKIEKAHVFQLLYYLYFLKKNAGIKTKGVLHYPLLKKRVDVELTQDKEKELEDVLDETSKIVSQEKPPEPIWLNYCKSCAYRELCWG